MKLMSNKKIIVILFLFFFFLIFNFNNCFAATPNFLELSEEGFKTWILEKSGGRNYPFGYHFICYTRGENEFSTSYGSSVCKFDCFKYRIVYFFPKTEDTIDVYFIYSNEEIYISYESGSSIPFFRTDNNTDLSHIVWNYSNNSFDTSKSIVSYNSLTGFYISNFNVKDSNKQIIIPKSSVYNLLEPSIGGYFVSVEDFSYFSYYLYDINFLINDNDDLFIGFYKFDWGSYYDRYPYILISDSSNYSFSNEKFNFSNEDKLAMSLYPSRPTSPNSSSSVNTSSSVDLSSPKAYFDSKHNVNKNVCIIGGKFNTEPVDEKVPDDPNPPVSNTETYTLYIDDFNFMKRFKFQFNVPILKEDTKIFCFLEDYTRNNYNSITAKFKFYTVSTPEGYDYSNYNNYLYYDSNDRKLYLPAGCIIERYNCTANNGELYSLNHETTYTCKRDTNYLYHSMSVDTSLNNIIQQSFQGGLSLEFNEDTLIPTSTYLNDFDSSSFLAMFGKIICKVPVLANVLASFKFNSLDEYFYYDFLHIFYYGYNINYSFEDDSNIFGYNFNDFLFGTTCIRGYENTKHLKPIFSGNFYNYFRSTNFYNMNNKLNDFTYFINYSDNQDVTSMLPEGTDTDYLTSPFYKGNENSSSGGDITYDIQEVIQGDKIIDYSKEDNSIHNNINNTYIENWNEGDNVVINKTDNPSIDKIYKTSQDILGILRLMYISILQMQTKMGEFGDLISNTTNNFTYNITNEIDYLFVPNKVILKDSLKQISDETDEHLGILAQGTQFLMLVGTLYSEMDNPDQIVLHIPEISYLEHTLIAETTFNFTTFMTEDLPFLGTMHNMYLTAVDLFFLWILIGFAQKIYDKFFGNGGDK